jgi:predicted Na+-dependent transporter
MTRLLNLFTNLFPFWVLLGGVLALIHPPLFTWFRGPAIVWGLAVIMLGMGVTLSVDDFKRVLSMPRAIATGFVAQYLIMPFLGWSDCTSAEARNLVRGRIDSRRVLSGRHLHRTSSRILRGPTFHSLC